MARVLIVRRRIVPVGIRYISLSSALCQVNTVRCERFRSDWVILDERMSLVNFYHAKRYTGVPFAPVCAPSVARPAASSSHPIYQCGIVGAKLQQEVQRILHNIERMKESKATLPWFWNRVDTFSSVPAAPNMTVKRPGAQQNGENGTISRYKAYQKE